VTGGPGKSVIAPLTGIRGFAALWVVLFHARGTVSEIPALRWIEPVVWWGYLGVDLFTFLSGFIISYMYCDVLSGSSKREIGRFLWIRLARIYPLHLFVLGLLITAVVWQQGLGMVKSLPFDKSLWFQVLLINGWGFESRWLWNAPSWTVSSEWFCYLCFPIVVPLLVRVERGWIAMVLAAATFAATAAALIWLGMPKFEAFLDYGLVRIGGEFLAGCWLYRAYRAGFGRGWPWGWVGLACLAGALVSSTTVPPVSAGLLGIVVYALSQNQQPIRWLFGNRVSVYLGEISYSIYLLHWGVLTMTLTCWENVDAICPPTSCSRSS